MQSHKQSKYYIKGVIRLRLKFKKVKTMNSENSIIKSALLSLFNKGKSEAEAYEEISKTHSSHQVTISVVNKWFEAFKSQEDTLDIKKKQGRKPIFTDEFLINLVNDNPGFNISQLARLANTSTTTISRRLKTISTNGESLYDRVIFNSKGADKSTDEFLIKLINENPNVNMKELSKIAGTSISTISNKLKNINCNEQIVNYNKKGFQNGVKKFTDEYLINLIKENPELNMRELSKIADVSHQTISNRLKQINSNRLDGDKIVSSIHKYKPFNNSTRITDENLIKLVEDNPNLNMTELADISNTSCKTLLDRLRKINSTGERISYVKKKIKFTDEYLINLVNENPELNMAELAKLAGTSQSTIFNRIKQINSSGQVINYRNKKNSNRARNLSD
jgi:transcriptional antiterminator